MQGSSLRAAILGVGAYVPGRVLTNHDLARMVDTSDAWIVERTGIRTRHVADPDVATSDLALPAAEEALREAGVSPGELDLIICATTMPDYLLPATACLVQDRLGARRAGAFDLLAACSGFVYGVILGSQMIAGGAARYVLVVGSEVLSKIVDWTDRTLCVLVGDGAGAVVLGPAQGERGVHAVVVGSDGSAGDVLKMPAGGTRLPASPQTVAQRLHYVRMDGRTLFRLAVRVVPEAVAEVVRRAGWALEEVNWIVPHQANRRIVEAVARALEMPFDRFLCNIDRYGNTSSASVPLALWEAVRDGRIREDDRVVLVAFGGGFTWAACALVWGR
ncbi:MAG: ketoacyl-ACP synthase III [Armatimonadetes bacterium]|nr:ketoacyl-ACP synthase III [Armatimonadota bacterium]MDW8154605.1 beta-ketoacyl-ACP synthase III [Armatimonadota bacterium]